MDYKIIDRKLRRRWYDDTQTGDDMSRLYRVVRPWWVRLLRRLFK